MALLLESFVVEVLVATVTICIFIYWYFNNNWDYWKKRNVPFCKPLPFVGNFKDRILVRKPICEIGADHYKELKGHKLGGIWLFKQPTLLIRDPEVIKRILVKHFSHFQDRGLNADEERNPLSAHLINLGGSKWRGLRIKLTPTFTSGKMRMMFSLMKECAHDLAEFLSNNVPENGELEIKEELAKFTTDIIGSCVFGLQFNSMKNPNSEFRAWGRRIFEPSALFTLQLTIFHFAPKLANFFNIRVPHADVSDFFLKVVHDTIEYREKNNVKRNDFMQLLIDLKNKGKVEDDHQDSSISAEEIPEEDCEVQDIKWTNNLLAAQAFIFFIAGFETSSTLMGFAVHELTVNLDIQEKLRNEIDNVLKETDGELTYEALKKMDYLDKVINETLRKYPPVSMLFRMCNKEFEEPDSGVLIEEGMRIQIPIYGLHHDPTYYPDPEQFDPERFSEDEKAKRHQYVYMPFGEGPRICIGMRFGLLQTKLGLATLLSRFELSRSSRTPHPLHLDPKLFVISSVGGIWVRLKPRATNIS